MIKKLDAKLALLLTVVAALVVLLVGWFGLIATERSKASNVDTQIAQKQDQLTAAQALVSTTTKGAAEAQFKAAEKVLPDDPRMSQVVRQFVAANVTAGTQIDSVIPGAVTTVGAGQAVPITLTVEGQYFAIRHFLALLQAHAAMKRDKVVGDGRLYSVDGIQFTEPMQTPDGGSSSSSNALGSSGATATKVPNTVKAVLNVNVFIAGAPPAPAAPVTPTGSSSTGDTTTTASGTTP